MGRRTTAGGDWIADFLAREALAESFRTTIAAVCEPLAAFAAKLRRDRDRPVLIGLCGAQGSGKSTIAAATAQLLQARRLSAVALSLDDVYLPKAARERLAQAVHPLFAARGPPGTHDTDLAAAVFDELRAAGDVALPAFDKAADEPAPRAAWRIVTAPVDVVLFEGWCVGARAQDPADVVRPVNALEAEEDPDAVWRGYVNDQLAGPYQALFARLDALALLQAPSFEVVLGWRAEQERKLIARTGLGMTPAELARFVAHYERLTRWILADLPARADLVFPLDAERHPITNR
jgi:D-glycerate 3-kinase